MKKSLLFGAAVALAAGATAQNLADGEYYIRHVETGYYLTNGWSWGTQGVLKEQPRAFKLTANEDGTYHIVSTVGGGEFKAEGEFWMDGGTAVATTLTKSGDHYTITVDGKNLAAGDLQDYTTGWLAEKVSCETTLYTIKYTETGDLFDILSRQQMIENLSAATPENPVEATFFIKAHNLEMGDNENIPAWKYTKGGEAAEIVLPDSGWGHDMGDWMNKGTYAWCSNDSEVDCEDVVSQEAEGLPEGSYRVKYRVVNQNNSPLAITFNTAVAEPVQFEETDLWYGSAATALAGTEKTADFYVGTDGKLAIKMTKQTKAGEQSRFAFKSFKIKYLGHDAGVDAIVADTDANAPVEYYNLQGIRVDNPAAGLYIKRQGKSVSKVYVK